MRDLSDVLKKMLKEIPSEEQGLIYDLTNILESTYYCAPEAMRMWWGETSYYLSKYFPDPNSLNEWQSKIINIWMNKNEK